MSAGAETTLFPDEREHVDRIGRRGVNADPDMAPILAVIRRLDADLLAARCEAGGIEGDMVWLCELVLTRSGVRAEQEEKAR